MAIENKFSSGVRIGHVHLKVSDLERSIRFYSNVLGFEVTSRYGNKAAFLSAGGYHHHIGLNTWNSQGDPPVPKRGVGLFHTAILVPTRKELAMVIKRLITHNISLTGAADHGASEAIYLDDPDGNGVEIYWDREKSEWPKKSDGTLEMYTKPLDLNALVASEFAEN